MLFCVEAQVALYAAMTQCTGGDHLGVQQGVLRQQTMEEPAVSVGPVHHGRNSKAPGTRLMKGCVFHTPIIINK